jgi:membrane-associated protease RseP (regulator of RpoE activity)
MMPRPGRSASPPGALFRHVDGQGTEWTLGLLSAGGYVSFAAERDALEAGGGGAPAPLARIVIIAAGPITNLNVASSCSSGF